MRPSLRNTLTSLKDTFTEAAHWDWLWLLIWAIAILDELDRKVRARRKRRETLKQARDKRKPPKRPEKPFDP